MVAEFKSFAAVHGRTYKWIGVAQCVRCASDFVQTRVEQRYCDAECRYKHWVSNNRAKHNASVRQYRARRYLTDGEWLDRSPKSAALKVWMTQLKSEPCTGCGAQFEVCCMDFDHRPGTDKKYNVGSMFAHHYARELIEAEIAKCDLVCSNCHRVRTRDRRRGSKTAKHLAEAAS